MEAILAVMLVLLGHTIARWQGTVFEAVEKFYWRLHRSKVFRCSTRGWAQEFWAGAPLAFHCYNCAHFGSQASHLAVLHVHHVRGRGPHGPPDPCLSTTKSALAALDRSRDRGEVLWVIDAAPTAAVQQL